MYEEQNYFLSQKGNSCVSHLTFHILFIFLETYY